MQAIKQEEEEKIPLQVLQQAPEAITKMLEEQYMKEIEKAAHSSSEGSKTSSDNASDKTSQPKTFTWWPWGRLPEKNKKDLPPQQTIEPTPESKIGFTVEEKKGEAPQVQIV